MDEVKRIPVNGTFELTARCNLSCKMCLIRLNDEAVKASGRRELTADEWIDMAKQVADAGTLRLLITGGEPMLRPDFCEIYEQIYRMGFIIVLYTNATLLNDNIVKLLTKCPPHEVGVTVYGASSDTYKKVCNNGDAYYKMLEGINELRKLPSKLSIRTTIIKDNLVDYEKIAEYAYGFGNEVAFNVNRIVTKAVRGGISKPEAYRLSPDESAQLFRKRTYEVVKSFQNYLDKSNININPDINKQKVDKEKRQTLYGCDAGMNSYVITWDGKLIGCELLQDCYTYALENGFMKAWDEFPDKVYLPPIPDKCIKCDVGCTVCPATRLAETGTLSGIPEYLCIESSLYDELNIQTINELKQSLLCKKNNYERGINYESLSSS